MRDEGFINQNNLINPFKGGIEVLSDRVAEDVEFAVGVEGFEGIDSRKCNNTISYFGINVIPYCLQNLSNLSMT